MIPKYLLKHWKDASGTDYSKTCVLGTLEPCACLPWAGAISGRCARTSWGSSITCLSYFGCIGQHCQNMEFSNANVNVCEANLHGITWSYCAWLVLPGIMTSSSIHVVANDLSFCFSGWILFPVFVEPTFFMPWSRDAQVSPWLGCL